ncbi:MAG: cache domain-containing protein [Syntrophotaleaceae bacterium]
MKNLKISHKIFLLIGSMLLVFCLVVSWLYLEAKQNYIKARRQDIQHVVETAWGVLDRYVQMVDQGRLSREEGRQLALETVRQLRFGEDNYFWINDFEPRMIMHPIDEELVGESLVNYRDPNGKELFVEMASLVRKQGEGFIEYVWHKPGSQQPAAKVSFVKELPEWGWIIGAGVYTDDIDEALAKIFYTTFGILAALLVSAVVVTLIVSRQISIPLQQAVEAMEKLGSGNFNVHLGMNRKDEIGRMANAIDACVASLRKIFVAIRSM